MPHAVEPSNLRDYILPDVVDTAATKYPDRLWMTVPRSDNLDEGWQDLTLGDLGRAVNNLAHWIERLIGVSHDRETLAYMRYHHTLSSAFQDALLTIAARMTRVTPSSRLPPSKQVTR